jgi:PAS domain S-box-containing protein
MRIRMRIAAVLLLLSIGALVAGTVELAGQAESVLRFTHRQLELNNNLRQLQTLLVLVGRAESGQRGFLLTGRDRYRAPYTEAASQLPPLLKQLDELRVVEPRTGRHIETIRQQVGAKLNELAETLQLVDRGHRDAALRVVETDLGQTLAESLRTETHALMDLVRNERDEASRTIVQATEKSRRIAEWTVGALLATLLLAGVQIALLTAARKRDERELADSERRHRHLIEQQSELISTSRTDGTLVYVNPAYARQVNQLAAELLGTSWFDWLHPADVADAQEQFAQLAKTGQPATAELRMAAPAASDRTAWIAWEHRLERSASDGPLVHSVGRDVTKRRMAEQALLASEEFLLRTGKVAGIGGWEFDVVSQRLALSDQVKHVHGLPPNAAPTLDDTIATYAPEAQGAIREAIDRALTKGWAWDLELPLIRPDGRRIHVRSVGEVDVDEHGVVRRLVGACQDVTERKQLEQRLEAREKFIREVADNVPVRIAYIDTRRRFQFVNREHCHRFGRFEDEIIGHTRPELTGRYDEAVESRLTAALKGRPQRFEFEDEVDGETRWIESQMIPDVGPDANVRGVFAIGTDITGRKANELSMRQLNEVFEHTPDHVLQTDWRGRILYMNPAARRALGIPATAPVQHRRFSDFNTAETNLRYETEIVPAVRRDGVWVGDLHVRFGDQRVVRMNCVLIAHRDAKGRLVRYSGILRELDRREALA